MLVGKGWFGLFRRSATVCTQETMVGWYQSHPEFGLSCQTSILTLLQTVNAPPGSVAIDPIQFVKGKVPIYVFRLKSSHNP